MNKNDEKKSAIISNTLPPVGGYEAELKGTHRKKSIVLRNVGHIKHFTEEEIRIESGRECVVMIGRNLACRIYAGRALCIEGEIRKILFEKE